MSLHLAIDLGATSGRAILAEYDGERVELQEVARFDNPMLPIGNHLYWNLTGLYNEILKVLRQLSASGTEIESIGIDSWGCDVAFFNEDGSLAGLPICYRDPYTDGASEEFFEKMPLSTLYSKTGIQVMDFNTIFQLARAVHKGERIMWIPDALAYMLTGRAVCEYTVASTSGMLDAERRDFDDDILEKLGLERRQFGEMVEPGTLVGYLTTAVQQATGMGRVPVYSVAGHDTASAVIGVPSEDEDYAYLSCGTWSLLGVESPTPILTDRARELNVTNEGGIDGKIRLLKNICGMWLLEQCRKEFADAPENVGELASLCLESDCESIVNPDDKRFSHPASMMAAIREYCAETGQAIPESTADYVRVIFRSLAQRYQEVLAMLTEISPVKVRRLHVIGGGSKNGHLMQMSADALGIPVIAGPAESTSLGNVLMQLRGLGRLATNDELRRTAINSVKTTIYQPKK